MYLAKVIGTVVATRKYKTLQGVKFLIIQPIDEYGENNGKPHVAVDGTEQAGPGEVVSCIASREGALVMKEWFNPADAGIWGIVDHVCIATDEGDRLTIDKYGE